MTKQRGMKLNHPNIDLSLNRETRLWMTCAHEAGHWVARKGYGFNPQPPVIITSESAYVCNDGRTIPKVGMQDLQLRNHLVDDAICCMAGPAVSARLEWFVDGCEGDYANVRKNVSKEGFPYSFEEIRVLARELVNQNWSAITRVADIVYMRNVGKVV